MGMPKASEPFGKDLVARKIVRLFERLGCPPVVVLKTPNAGNTVDNGCGADVDLAPYAVIHDENLVKMRAQNRILGWQVRHKTEIMKFDVHGCEQGIDALVNELKGDGYEVVWRKEGR